MNNEYIISPSTLSIIVTNKCTAACRNCCFKCSPQNTDILSINEIKSYIDQSIEAYPMLKVIVFTGGECFILGNGLTEAVHYASQKGKSVRVVSNAFWAKTFKEAYNKLSILKNVGLSELNISTGDEHQEWIPYDNIINAITAALRLNFKVVVNVESHPESTFKVSNLENDVRLQKYDKNQLIILAGAWIIFDKEQEVNNKNNQKKYLCLTERCKSLFTTISITPHHEMLACCGLTAIHDQYLRLGSLKKHTVKELYEYQFKDFLKLWVFTEGPKKILKYINDKRKITENGLYEKHMCSVCAQLFNNPENIKFIRNNYDDIQANVLLKFFLLKKSMGLN